MAFTLLGSPAFWVLGDRARSVLMVFTSAFAFWADYWHIERPRHVAHAVDRVAAWVSVLVLGHASIFVLGFTLLYSACALVLSVGLFVLSRSSTHPLQWALYHTLWHWVPAVLLFGPPL